MVDIPFILEKHVLYLYLEAEYFINTSYVKVIDNVQEIVVYNFCLVISSLAESGY